MSFTKMGKSKAILYALLAAAFYAVNVPVSKLLLSQVGPTMMAAGATVAAADTLIRSHEHEHQHTYTHFHDGQMHTHNCPFSCP